MKIVQIVVGSVFLILAAICPLPPILAVPGVVWRIAAGLLSCTSILSGISGLVQQTEGSEEN